MNYKEYKMTHEKVPQSIYYIPNFITSYEHECLLTNITTSPIPKWTVLSNRRLQNWGGIVDARGMIQEPLPRWLQTYSDKLSKLDLFDGNVANHALINEYTAGQGIMPHEDGPLFYPTITTINLGSHTVLNFYQKTQTTSSGAHSFSLLLQPRSLLILKEDAYNSYLHGIEERTSDLLDESIVNMPMCENVSDGQVINRSTRISITIRYVPKIIKCNLLSKLMNK